MNQRPVKYVTGYFGAESKDRITKHSLREKRCHQPRRLLERDVRANIGDRLFDRSSNWNFELPVKKYNEANFERKEVSSTTKATGIRCSG